MRSTDLVFLFIGIPLVYNFQIPILKKVTIRLVLSSGLMAIISGIVRCVIVETSTNTVNAHWANIEVVGCSISKTNMVSAY